MKRRRNVGTAAVLLATTILMAACGPETASEGSGAGADVAAAEAFIADYVGQPSEFPTDERLTSRPAPGTKVVFVDAGTRIGELQWTLVQPGAKQLGIDLVRVEAGVDATSVSTAFDTVVSMKPDGVLIAAVNPLLYARQLEELREQGVTVVATAANDGAKYGFDAVTFGDPDVQVAGELLGAWTIARSEGKADEIALYTVPELSFSDLEIESAQAKIAELCPECETRIVEIPVSQLGSTASQTVVSDIQAHPGTDFAVFATDEIGIGLPSALSVAGLELKTVGAGASPANLEQIKAGQEDAALGTDLNIQMWSLVDQFAREYAGQALSGAQARGEIVKQFLTKEDLTFDPSLGWTGYPDVAERFADLWDAAATS